MTGPAITFRPMALDDLSLLHEWLERPHVKRWYGQRGSFEEMSAYYRPALEGREPTDHFVVLLDQRPVGMLQTYLVADYPDYASVVGVRDRQTAGVDILIGEETLTGRGLGSVILRRFVDEVVFSRLETSACVADPEVGNVASIRAFEKAGFRIVREFVEEPGDGEVHALMQRDRPRTGHLS